MNLAVTVSLESVHTFCSFEKTSIFPYTLLKLFARDG